ncbi:MAG: hypothetical protein IJT96_03810 [Lachnospiraceae bacterium]|nr:hypothetical protein [Lachnospiraceae bacterium]
MGKIKEFYKVVSVDLDELYIPDEHSVKARNEVKGKLNTLNNRLPMATIEGMLEYTWEIADRIISEYEISGSLNESLSYLIDLFAVIQGERLIFEREQNISYGDYIGSKKMGSMSIAHLHSMLDIGSSKNPDDKKSYTDEWILSLEKVWKMMAGYGILDNLNITRTVMVDLMYLMTTAYFLLNI